jgi:Nickel responsive protein SCO4226-like
MALRKYVIEREIPKVGSFEREQLRAAAQKSNEVLTQLGPDIQWVESFVAARDDLLHLLGEGRGDHS